MRGLLIDQLMRLTLTDDRILNIKVQTPTETYIIGNYIAVYFRVLWNLKGISIMKLWNYSVISHKLIDDLSPDRL